MVPAETTGPVTKNDRRVSVETTSLTSSAVGEGPDDSVPHSRTFTRLRRHDSRQVARASLVA